jgi:hypothetical protein
MCRLLSQNSKFDFFDDPEGDHGNVFTNILKSRYLDRKILEKKILLMDCRVH